MVCVQISMKIQHELEYERGGVPLKRGEAKESLKIGRAAHGGTIFVINLEGRLKCRSQTVGASGKMPWREVIAILIAGHPG